MMLKGFNKGKKRSFKFEKESECHTRITFDFSLQDHLLVFEIWIFTTAFCSFHDLQFIEIRSSSIYMYGI